MRLRKACPENPPTLVVGSVNKYRIRQNRYNARRDRARRKERASLKEKGMFDFD